MLNIMKGTASTLNLKETDANCKIALLLQSNLALSVMG